MLLIGLDAAAQLEHFGYAIGEYDPPQVRVREAGLLRSVDRIDALLASRIRTAERALIAIDAPLGWPASLGPALVAHYAGQPLGVDPNALFRRDTDRFVRERWGRQPLEVGADRIARAAVSALAVLGRLRESSGSALPVLVSIPPPAPVSVAEVYPAVTLKSHGAPHSGYKQPEQRAVRAGIAAALGSVCDGLADLVDERADVFDAALCLIAAVDILEGRCALPRDAALAQREGWIWVRA
jgi:hypothetical protein